MRSRSLIGSLVVVATVCLVTGQLLSQDTAAKKPENKPAAGMAAQGQKTEGQQGQMPPDMAEMMKKYQEMNALGPQHKELAKCVGTWDVNMKCSMSPDAPPMESKGVATFRMLLDGRYVQQEYKGESMGQPYVGMGIEGYDNLKKQYVSTWMDCMSTGIMIMHGTADASGKVVTYEGKEDCPMTGEKDKKIKAVLRHLDADHVAFEMYDTMPDGKEFKTMEMQYTRRM